MGKKDVLGWRSGGRQDHIVKRLDHLRVLADLMDDDGMTAENFSQRAVQLGMTKRELLDKLTNENALVRKARDVTEDDEKIALARRRLDEVRVEIEESEGRVKSKLLEIREALDVIQIRMTDREYAEMTRILLYDTSLIPRIMDPMQQIDEKDLEEGLGGSSMVQLIQGNGTGLDNWIAMVWAIQRFIDLDPMLSAEIVRFYELLRELTAKAVRSETTEEGGSLVRLTSEFLQKTDMHIARLAYLVGGKHFADDTRAMVLLRGFAMYWRTRGKIEQNAPIVAVTRWIEEHLDDQIFRDRLTFGGRWAASDYADVRVDDKLAAALVFTDLPDDFVDDELMPPWPAFRVQLPHGMFPTKDGQSCFSVLRVHQRSRGTNIAESLPALSVAMQENVGAPKSSWWLSADFRLAADAGWVLVETVRRAPNLSGLVHIEEQPSENLVSGHRSIFGTTQSEVTEVASEHDRRIMSMFGRLVIGLCLRMSDPTAMRKRSSKALAKSGRGRRIGGPPQTTEWILGGDVKIDLRAEARELALGKKNVQYKKVQWLVRGHWRNQAHGKGRTLRRRQWIEPFWKGPEKAPILVRSHTLDPDAAAAVPMERDAEHKT